MRLQHRKSSERGAALVEGALVYGSFFFLLIGTIDLGQVMFTHQNLKERVREAARYGIARHSDADLTTSVRNIVLYGSPKVPTDGTPPTPLLGMGTANVVVTRVAGGYALPDRLTVRATGYQYTTLTPMIAGVKTGKDITVSLPMENP